MTFHTIYVLGSIQEVNIEVNIEDFLKYLRIVKFALTKDRHLMVMMTCKDICGNN